MLVSRRRRGAISRFGHAWGVLFSIAAGCATQGGAGMGSGGSAGAAGGTTGGGGASSSGGRSSGGDGGPNSGGAQSLGGAPATGGAQGVGGIPATGGTSASGGIGGKTGPGGAGGAPTGGGSGGKGGAGGQNLTELRAQAPFVAVGERSIRAFSADGKTWVTAPDPTTLPAGWTGPPESGDNKWLLRGGCVGAGQFLVVGGYALTSPDGQAWTLAADVQSADECAFGMGRFITTNRFSADGHTWQALPKAISSRAMVFGGGVFASVADNGGGSFHYSKDGQAWTSLAITYVGTDANRLGYNIVTYGGGHFLAASTAKMDSPILEWDGGDPKSFTETPRATLLGSNVQITAVAYGRQTAVIASPGFLYRRPAGSTTWQKTAYTGPNDLHSLVVTDSLYVTAGAWSADGVTWTNATNAPRAISKVIPTMGASQ